MNLETGVGSSVNAPGCYGHASVFSHSNSICKACPAFAECGQVVESKLKAFSSKVDVSDHVKRHANGKVASGILHELEVEAAVINLRDVPERKQKVARVKKVLNTAELALMETLPKKVQVEAKKLIAVGTDKVILTDLQSGKNPFPFEGKRYLHVACDLLLKGGFTKSSLRQEYMDRLPWTKETAFSHVSMIISLFTAFGVIKEGKGSVFSIHANQ